VHFVVLGRSFSCGQGLTIHLAITEPGRSEEALGDILLVEASTGMAARPLSDTQRNTLLSFRITAMIKGGRKEA